MDRSDSVNLEQRSTQYIRTYCARLAANTSSLVRARIHYHTSLAVTYHGISIIIACWEAGRLGGWEDGRMGGHTYSVFSGSFGAIPGTWNVMDEISMRYDLGGPGI